MKTTGAVQEWKNRLQKEIGAANARAERIMEDEPEIERDELGVDSFCEGIRYAMKLFDEINNEDNGVQYGRLPRKPKVVAANYDYNGKLIR